MLTVYAVSLQSCQQQQQQQQQQQWTVMGALLAVGGTACLALDLRRQCSQRLRCPAGMSAPRYTTASCVVLRVTQQATWHRRTTSGYWIFYAQVDLHTLGFMIHQRPWSILFPVWCHDFLEAYLLRLCICRILATMFLSLLHQLFHTWHLSCPCLRLFATTAG